MVCVCVRLGTLATQSQPRAGLSGRRRKARWMVSALVSDSAPRSESLDDMFSQASVQRVNQTVFQPPGGWGGGGGVGGSGRRLGEWEAPRGVGGVEGSGRG